MKLKSVKLYNFRGYRNETEINFNNLTAFVGKNDVGKSTIIEALEIFFNSKVVKIQKEDLNVEAASVGEYKIEITCIFTELPINLIIDAACPTTLQDEYLLNSDGNLEVKKVFSCSSKTPSEKVFIIANHPTVVNGNDLLTLKRAELRTRANEINVPVSDYNGNINTSIRRAIWKYLGALNLSKSEIQVDKEDTKLVWEYLEKWMPQFALFKSDRESSDSDKEITDPMKIAVDAAISELSKELAEIQASVKKKAIEVADRTLAKLQEMNPSLANELTPEFKAEPKWSSLFNLTLSSDKNIPINKRGSGVRRLIVLSFFRAEAERRRNENNSKSIIYAFEEPENSQHPYHQEMLIKAFQDLSESNNTQVILTTHNPAIAGLINENNLRLVTKNHQGENVILGKQQNVFRIIADSLGMLPDPLKPKLLVCVEGPNDVSFLKIISKMIHENRKDLPDLSANNRIAIFPLGGGTLKDWVTQDYLSGLGIPQFHLYDLDNDKSPPYLSCIEEVRAKGGNNWAELTVKRETENYLHPKCIQKVFGFDVNFNDMDDVPELIASIQHNLESPISWNDLQKENKKKKVSRVKKRLNDEVVKLMKWEDLEVSDSNGDIIRWLEAIRDRIR